MLQSAVFEGGAQHEERCAGKSRQERPPGSEEDWGGEGVEDDPCIARMADEAVGSGGADDMTAVGLQADVGGKETVGRHRPILQGASQQKDEHCEELPNIGDRGRPVMAEIEPSDKVRGDEGEQEYAGEHPVPEFHVLFACAAAFSNELEGGEERG